MGSTTHIVDEAGAVQNRYEYDAWGNITAQEEAVPNRFKFTGQQLDPVTQQYYLRARFYNPVIARFTQEDNYRGDGLNLYVYCSNNSTYYTDPSGQYTQCMKDAYLAARKAGMSKEDTYSYAKDIYQKNHISDTPDGYVLMSNNNVRRLLEGRGLDSHTIDNAIHSFDGPIYARQGRAGEVYTLTSDSPDRLASGVYVTRGSAGSTPSERINNLALPKGNSARIETQVALARDQILLEGRVAAQPEFAASANDGIPRIGGGWQVVTDGGRKNGAIVDLGGT